eukprot:2905755-Rhodomonas_salina.1
MPQPPSRLPAAVPAIPESSARPPAPSGHVFACAARLFWAGARTPQWSQKRCKSEALVVATEMAFRCASALLTPHSRSPLSRAHDRARQRITCARHAQA